MKADLLAMTASRTKQSVALKLNTSLCYNPDKERLTITIYDLEGLEVIIDLSKISIIFETYNIKYCKLFSVSNMLTFEAN